MTEIQREENSLLNRIEIPLSKKKVILLLCGVVVFVLAGAFFIITPETFERTALRLNSDQIRIIGGVAVLFFGAAGVFGFRKMMDKQMGLIIDDQGIYDNSNALSVGLIRWEDVVGIKTEEVSSTRFLLIYVSNPESYLTETSGWKRKLMKANENMYGTPLSITTNTLKCDFKWLEQLLSERLHMRLLDREWVDGVSWNREII